MQNEPSWLQQSRAAAQQRWQRASPPTLRSEDYRYTNIKPLLSTEFNTPATTSALKPTDYATLLHPDEYRWVFSDGQFVAAQSDPLPAGVQCLNVRQAIDDGLLTPDTLPAVAHADYLQLLNDVCFYDGLYLQVAAGTRLDRPLHLIFVNDKQAAHTAMFNRNIIDVQDNATLHLIETHLGLTAESYLAVTHTSLSLGTAAECAYVKLQSEGAQAYHFSTVEYRQQQNSRLSALNISHGGQLARLSSNIEQLGEGASCDFRTVYLGKQQQVLDNYSQVKHLVAAGTTTQRVRGIVSERARGIFTGNIRVPRQAQRTDAAQLTKNLLLGKDCTVYIRPQLQIEADDVKCSHGATSARIAARDLFYLASRGIDATTATRLLCRAHVEELAQDLPIATAKRFFDMVLDNFLD